MQRWTAVWVLAVAAGVVLLTTAAARPFRPEPLPSLGQEAGADLTSTAARVDQELQRLWGKYDLSPAAPADDLTVLRRLSLALHGTIPSLEEIRAFEVDTRPDRLDHWLTGLLSDNRFNDYFAERLARGFVGVGQDGQPFIFRRDRFKTWLSQQLERRVPYDQIVRDMIAAEGVWTGDGEVNFLTAAFTEGECDPNELTARTTRAFLGQRIDCAQCHNHPFDHWKQSEFEGLAAYYGKVALTVAGVVDKDDQEFRVGAVGEEAGRLVEPAVPFSPEWIPTDGSPRSQLGAWITHPDNKRFDRAIANRVWGFLFGKPFLPDRPVDDLPDPDVDEDLQVLDVLGADFRVHNCDLRRLVQVITATQAFRMSSIHPLTEKLDLTAISADKSDELQLQLEEHERRWAVFPLIRLRPEQVIGSMLQATNIRTIDQNSHLLVRVLRFARENDFVNEFGDPGVDELQDRVGTIPQALLRMNGEFSRELTEPNPFLAAGRIIGASATPDKAVEAAFLVCLTRRPTPEERAYYAGEWDWESDRGAAMQDLYWDLYNAPEFSWNH